MKDYSLFVNSAYIVTFAILILFSLLTYMQFKKSSKELTKLDAKKSK